MWRLRRKTAKPIIYKPSRQRLFTILTFFVLFVLLFSAHWLGHLIWLTIALLELHTQPVVAVYTDGIEFRSPLGRRRHKWQAITYSTFTWPHAGTTITIKRKVLPRFQIPRAFLYSTNKNYDRVLSILEARVT